MTGSIDVPPSHDDLVRELRQLREKGLIRLRHLDLPALAAAAQQAAGPDGAVSGPLAVELLLRRAVDALGGDTWGTAAEYLFGLVRGTLGWRTRDLRDRAAREYGVTPETFRKEPESLLIGRIADEILLLAVTGPAGRGEVHRPDATSTVREQLVQALRGVVAAPELTRGAPSGPDPTPTTARTFGPFGYPFGPATVSVTLHAGPIEELSGVDVVVSSENTLLEPAKPFKSSLSGRLRNAAAIKDAAGTVVQDVLALELAAWVRQHGRAGLPIEAGRVVPTSSGALADRGIRRIYHAAVVTPRAASNDYDVDPESLGRAVHSCLALAREERSQVEPPLTSISFPLFGAGRGGLDPAASFTWIWTALAREMRVDPSWALHLTVLNLSQAATVLNGLLEALPTPGPTSGRQP